MVMLCGQSALPVSYTHLDVYKRQKQAWKTGRYAGIQYSLSPDKKDSGTKKSYLGIVRKAEIGYSKNSCLLYTSRCV